MKSLSNICNEINNIVNELSQSEENTYKRYIGKLNAMFQDDAIRDACQCLKQGVDIEKLINQGRSLGGSMVGSASFPWPTDQKAELGTVIALTERFASNDHALIDFAFDFYYAGSNVTSNIQKLAREVYVRFARDFRTYLLETKSKPNLQPQIHNQSRKIFIVHGHDEYPLLKMKEFLNKMQLEPIVLHQLPSQGKTIIEKIEANSDVRFAIILMTADDEGGKKGEAPRPRVRQNVLLELGYFIGRLGRSKVCALHCSQEIEIPTDFDGVVYLPYGGDWKLGLIRELKAAGFEIDANQIL